MRNLFGADFFFIKHFPDKLRGAEEKWRDKYARRLRFFLLCLDNLSLPYDVYVISNEAILIYIVPLW